MVLLTFFEDAATFGREASAYLTANPVLTTVVATTTDALTRSADPVSHPRWWVIVRGDDGEVVSVAMRTAPFEPYPVYVLPMSKDAAEALADALHARGEHVGGVGGALETGRVFAEACAHHQGGVVRVSEEDRLFELTRLVPPGNVANGGLRLAEMEDLARVVDWFRRFFDDAMAQAGRPPDPARRDSVTEAQVAARIRDGVIGLWEDADEIVHLTAWYPPAHGVVRIGPVYTPAEHRGRGYASAAVAEVSRRILAAGDRPCLFTDRANSTSNRVYEALGYQPVVDMAALQIVPSS